MALTQLRADKKCGGPAGAVASRSWLLESRRVSRDAILCGCAWVGRRPISAIDAPHPEAPISFGSIRFGTLGMAAVYDGGPSWLKSPLLPTINHPLKRTSRGVTRRRLAAYWLGFEN
jgi:hypothetical protein